MRTKYLLTAFGGLCIILVLSEFWSPTPIQGTTPKTYEVRPRISIPEYRSDAARAIDAYERLMERYMNLTELRFIGFGADLEGIADKLDSINHKLTELSAKMARIEKALGIEQPQKLIKKTPAAPIRPGAAPRPLKKPQKLPSPKKTTPDEEPNIKMP